MIKKKQIEKAAFKCLDAPCIRDCEKCQDEQKEHCTWSYIIDGFVMGALWRIKKVWHDMGAEVPQIYGDYGDSIYPQIPCLVVGILSTGYGYGVRYWNVTEQYWDDEECDGYECDKDKIEKWAYLDDLIPERGNKMSYDMDMCEAMTHNGYVLCASNASGLY